MKNKNKKKKTKLDKSKYIKYCIIAVIIILLGTAVYFFLNSEENNTKLTILEKRWIMDNKNTLIDINVPNNLSIVADNGSGIVFDYISKIQKETDLRFNKKSYNYLNDNNLSGLSILVLDNGDKLKKEDSLLTEDSYILASTNEAKLTELTTAYNSKVGVLKDEKIIVKKNLGNVFQYEEYATIGELTTALTKKKIDYLIAPRYYSLKSLALNKIYINYTFSDITNKIVLRTNDNKKLTSITKKYLDSFKKNNYTKSYEKEFMKFYLANTQTTDVETTSLSRKIYNYGYVKNNVYSVEKSNHLYGYAGEYINSLANMANIDLELKEYRNKKRLNEAIERGEIDIAFIDYDYDNNNGLYTINAFTPKLIALSETNYSISDKKGLNNRKLYTLKGTYLERYLKSNYNGTVTTIRKTTSNIPKDGILVLDELNYYYANKKDTSKYYTILKDDYNASYRFFIKNDEEVLHNFMNFILMYSDSNAVQTNSVNNLIEATDTTHNFKSLYFLVVLIIIIPVVILFMLLALSKTRKNAKTLRKEDRLRYNDMLTSLKNRNYLRAHVDEWDEAKITPRTIIIADLNKLKYVNDNYGSSEGNDLIKKAAAILINTQLEKSEIIRTDGNEFLIYLIGYNEKQINTYINKLSREFERLPYGFGAAMGYSMILDEIKTIDDAINEASIKMREDKEQNYK